MDALVGLGRLDVDNWQLIITITLPSTRAMIVELGGDFYMHQEYGKTHVPVFTIIGWAD